jgi:elongation factor Ts
LQINAEMVKTLRDQTDAGMMDCKKALQETGGDLEKAIAYLRQKGLVVAHKRAGRATSEGSILAYVSPDHNSGVVLEVNCETDFVAKTQAFLDLGAKLVEHLGAVALETVEELLAEPCPHLPGLTVTDYLNDVIAKTGESIRVRRFVRYATRDGVIAAYIHHGGRLGVLLELGGAGPAPKAQAAAKDLAMQVAAANPVAVSREEVSPDLVAREKAIYEAQAKESGKPEKIIERMVAGRLEKFYKEVCLLEQPFVKNPDITVAQYLKEVGTASGGKELKVRHFARYQVGAA